MRVLSASPATCLPLPRPPLSPRPVAVTSLPAHEEASAAYIVPSSSADETRGLAQRVSMDAGAADVGTAMAQPWEELYTSVTVPPACSATAPQSGSSYPASPLTGLSWTRMVLVSTVSVFLPPPRPPAVAAAASAADVAAARRQTRSRPRPSS